MIKTIYTDNKGRKYISTIRNTGDDPSIGILEGPPDLEQLDWNEIKTNLHNTMLDKKLFNLDDIQRRTKDLEHAVNAAVIKSIYRLYQKDNGSLMED